MNDGFNSKLEFVQSVSWMGIVFLFLTLVQCVVLYINREYFFSKFEKNSKKILITLLFWFLTAGLFSSAGSIWIQLFTLPFFLFLRFFLSLQISEFEGYDSLRSDLSFFVMFTCGLFLLTKTGISFRFDSLSSPSIAVDVFGAALVLSSALVISKGFPQLSFWYASTQVPIHAEISRVLLLSVVFFVFSRLEPFLRDSEVWIAFGWVYLFFSSLTALSALFQKQSKLVHFSLPSVSFLLSLALMIFVGTQKALGFFMGAQLGIICIYHLGATKEIWVRVIAILLAASFFPFMGFDAVSFTSQAFLERPVECAALSVSLSLWVALIFSLGFFRKADSAKDSIELKVLLTQVFLFLLSLLCVWSGELLPKSFFGEPVQFFSFALFDQMVKLEPSAYVKSTLAYSTPLGSLLCVGIYLFGLLVSFSAKIINERGTFVVFEKIIFLARLDQPFERTVQKVSEGFVKVETAVHQTFWEYWLQPKTTWLIWQIVDLIWRNTVRVFRGTDLVLVESIHFVSKATQRVQTGRIQHYLMFAVGTMILILLHFLLSQN